MPQSRLGSQVDREALGALAALSERVPAGLVDEVLTVFERLIDRPPGQVNVVDDDVRRGLFGLYRAHPSRQEWIGQALLRCIQLGGDIGYKTALMPFETDLLGPLLPGLREQAEQGVPNAILALAMAEDRHPAVLAEAERRVDGLLAEEPRSWSAGGFQAPLFGRPRTDAACFGLLLPPPSIERLARHLLRLATEGTGDFDPTRADALDGITILAGYLPDPVRDELVHPVPALAQASADSSFDKLWQGTLHPLSTGKVDVGRRRAAAAVVAAAGLARRPEHGETVLASASEPARQNVRPAPSPPSSTRDSWSSTLPRFSRSARASHSGNSRSSPGSTAPTRHPSSASNSPTTRHGRCGSPRQRACHGSGPSRRAWSNLYSPSFATTRAQTCAKWPPRTQAGQPS